MTENTHIADNLKDVSFEKKKKRYKLQILTGQILTIVLSLYLFILSLAFYGSIGDNAGIFTLSSLYLLCSMVSFRWPFLYLLIAILLYNAVIYALYFERFVIMLTSLYREYIPGSINYEELTIYAAVHFAILFFMVRALIAARKYTQLKKQ